MTIKYRTEGRTELKSSQPNIESAAITWERGGLSVSIHQGSVSIHQGSTRTVVIDKAMLLQLIAEGIEIADDIQPNMESLPRPA